MQVVVDGLMTDYERQGKGQPVLMLHGWGDSLRSFDKLSAVLQSKFEVIRLDLPGFGKTSSPKSAWGLVDYATFVAKFLAKIGASNLHTVIGFSNGGAISIKGLSVGLISSENLVLLASSGMRGEYRGRNRALRLIAKTGKLLTKPLPGRAKKRLRKAVYQTVGSDMLVVEKLQETFKKVIGEDVQVDVPNIKAKTLLVYGDQDTATPVRYGQRFKELFPAARLEVVKGSGHFLMLDQPDKVNQLVAEFLL